MIIGIFHLSLAIRSYKSTASRSCSRLSITSLKTHNRLIKSTMKLHHQNEIITRKMHELIDVDCNLMHPDLHQSLYSNADSETTDEKEKLGTSSPDFFRILSHPSMDQANISAIFSPASTIEEAKIFLSALKQLTCNNIPIKTSVGVHPFHVLDSSLPSSFEEAQQEIRSILLDRCNNKVNQHFIACIGEAGLDYSEGFPQREEQLPWWEMQVKLALEFQLPLFVHERLAFQDMAYSLEQYIFIDKEKEEEDDEEEGPAETETSTAVTRIPVIIHCFTGTQEECRYYISRGCFISVSGFILRSGPGPEEVRTCIRQGLIPLEKIMIETDAPFMGFPTCRELHFETDESFQAETSNQKKKRLLKGTYPNVPSALPKIFDCVIDLLNEGRYEKGIEPYSREYVSRVLRDNSVRFFGFKF